MAVDPRRLKDLFAAASELPALDRGPYLDRECGGDAELRAQVEGLLHAHDAAGHSQTEAGGTGAFTPTPDEPPHTGGTSEFRSPAGAGAVVAGRYTLIESIGEGGMGEVWAAVQSEPVRRRVAVKLIKAGMDTRSVLQRFNAERQALALMDHPNIAKVFDGGMTGEGRPFFVMELVDGLPLTKFCDDAKLGIRQRLELFVAVCQAAQHAHQKGVVHRDLKPSNILVTVVDGRPLPKVIDFGVAKAVGGKLVDDTLSTGLGAAVGTLEYMSPEQAGFSGPDVDTRADIYSLGVILYELLTGLRPIDSQRLRKAAITEMVRIIREEEPSKPSTRLSTNESTPSLAALRATEPRALMALLRGGLDWVVMKCLEKDRNRRYETASGLARDIQRYLADEPVEAAPPGTAYRLRKFVARNRATVLAGAAVAAALLVGAVGFAWQAHRAGVQRDLAIAAERAEADERRIAEEQRAAAEAQRNRAVAAEADAKKRADELNQVADFQAQMLAQVDPTIAGARLTEDVRARFAAALDKAGVPADKRPAQVDSFADQWSRVNATDAARELIDRTILKPAVAAIDTQFKAQPVVAASLRSVLGERYHDLGLDEAALSLGQQALAERRRVLGPDHPETLIAIGNVGAYLAALGRYAEAEPFDREALEKSRRVLGNDHPSTLLAVSNLGVMLRDFGKTTDAEPLLREALAGRRRILGEEHPETLQSINDRGRLLFDQGKFADAEASYRDALAKRRRVLGEDHADTLTSINDLAVLLKNQGKMDEAAALFRELAAKRRRALGEAHPKTLNAIGSLGATLDASGHSDEAGALLRESLENRRRLLGADHPDTLATLGNYAVFLINQNKLAEAEPLCRETLDRRRRVVGENHASTLVALNVLGLVLTRQGKNAEAEVYWRDALDIARRTLGPAHPETLIYTHNLGSLMLDEKKPTEAEALFREVIRAGTPAVGPGHPTVLSATRRTAAILLEQKRNAEAVELLAAAEPHARKTYTGSGQRNLAQFLTSLGRARNRAGQYAAAEANLLEGNAIIAKVRGPAHAETLGSNKLLAEFYTAWDKAEPGKGHDAKAAEWKAKLPKEGDKPAEKK